MLKETTIERIFNEYMEENFHISLDDCSFYVNREKEGFVIWDFEDMNGSRHLLSIDVRGGHVTHEFI